MPHPRAPRIAWLVVAAAVAVGLTTTALSAPGPDPATEPDAATSIAAAPRRLPRAPRPAPAPAATGTIERVSVDGTLVSISGWARDLDRPESTQLRVSLDGALVATVDAAIARPDVEAAGGAGHGFELTVELTSDRPTDLCLHTAPDDDLVTCTRVAPESWNGVLITPRGVMVEILDVLDAGYLVLTPCANEAVVEGGERRRTTQILIDPGHGGSEVASVGPNGLSEKTLNLNVAKRTARKLRELGYDVELTRTRDLRLPIATRAGLANALDPDLFLSLHHNGGATARQSHPGTQVYYQHDDDEARRAGGIIYEELFAAATRFPTAWVGNSKDGVSTRLNGRGTDFYGIHRRTPDVPSVITEFLWLSNGPEARLLAQSRVRDAEAEALATGIDRWYRSRHRGSGYLPAFVDTFDSGGGGFEGCVDPPL